MGKRKLESLPTSCDIQKRGPKPKQAVPEIKLECFAFRYGKSCERNASLATGLCDDCVITNSMGESYKRFLHLLKNEALIAASHWRTLTHLYLKKLYESSNDALIKENEAMFHAMHRSTSSVIATNPIAVLPIANATTLYEDDVSEGKDEDDTSEDEDDASEDEGKDEDDASEGKDDDELIFGSPSTYSQWLESFNDMAV
jgi:hypothetical protein